MLSTELQSGELQRWLKTCRTIRIICSHTFTLIKSRLEGPFNNSKEKKRHIDETSSSSSSLVHQSYKHINDIYSMWHHFLFWTPPRLHPTPPTPVRREVERAESLQLTSLKTVLSVTLVPFWTCSNMRSKRGPEGPQTELQVPSCRCSRASPSYEETQSMSEQNCDLFSFWFIKTYPISLTCLTCWR